MNNGLKVAVVGATGAVGRELLSILEERKFPVRELLLFSSPRSEGKIVQWPAHKGKSHHCQVLKKGCFEGVQVAFFDVADALSREWVPHAAEAGSWVVDSSAVFRMEQDIPLVVPEVNGAQLEARLKSNGLDQAKGRARIISGPNCSAAPLAVALKPFHDRWGLRRVVVTTFQSVSGAGASAMEELSTQTRGLFNQQPVVPKIFPHQIAFNCIPHIGSFKFAGQESSNEDDGYTGEEQKIIAETRKLLELPQLKMSATAVRVPTFSCHAESVNIECERPFKIEEVREALRAQAGVILQDDPQRNIYPMGLTAEGDAVEGASGRDAVYVGRIRKDSSVECGLNLWLVSDNLRKGAALNAVQIAEVLLKAVR